MSNLQNYFSATLHFEIKKEHFFLFNKQTFVTSASKKSIKMFFKRYCDSEFVKFRMFLLEHVTQKNEKYSNMNRKKFVDKAPTN